jgi:hypothetical protein
MVNRVAASSRPSRLSLGTAIQAMVLLLLLAIFGAVVLVLFAVASLLNVPGQMVGGVSGGLGGAAASAGQALSAAERSLRNAADPAHPPSGLTYDTEYSALHTWHLTDQLPPARDYVLTLQAIRRREGSESPDTALYAMVHAELREPRETRLLGQVVRTDRDARDYVVYKGESFRIGRTLYRVNWVSQEDGALAAGAYRHPDAVSAALKFEYD